MEEQVHVERGVEHSAAVIRATNRQALIAAVRQKIEAAGLLFSPDVPYLQLTRFECGAVVEYWSEEEVPATSVPCPCGDPSHWMIRYDDHEEE